MKSGGLLPLIFLAAAAIAVWNLIGGFRSGRMHFGLGSVSANVDRATDATGFWALAALNAAAVSVAAAGLLRTEHLF